MKITRQENPSEFFGEIENGEVFQYEGDIYMAIDEITVIGASPINAIKLETGDLVFFPCTKEVTPLPEAKLVY